MTLTLWFDILGQLWKFSRKFCPPFFFPSGILFTPMSLYVTFWIFILFWSTFQFNNSLLTEENNSIILFSSHLPQLLFKLPIEFLILGHFSFSFQFFNSSLSSWNILIISDNIFTWITCLFPLSTVFLVCILLHTCNLLFSIQCWTLYMNIIKTNLMHKWCLLYRNAHCFWQVARGQ